MILDNITKDIVKQFKELSLDRINNGVYFEVLLNSKELINISDDLSKYKSESYNKGIEVIVTESDIDNYKIILHDKSIGIIQS